MTVYRNTGGGREKLPKRSGGASLFFRVPGGGCLVGEIYGLTDPDDGQSRGRVIASRRLARDPTAGSDKRSPPKPLIYNGLLLGFIPVYFGLGRFAGRKQVAIQVNLLRTNLKQIITIWMRYFLDQTS